MKTYQPENSKKVNNWLDIIQQWLFPPTCILCGSAGEGGWDLCALCQADLPLNTICCPCCANPMIAYEEARLCGQCLRRSPAFDKVYAPFLHQEGIRYLVTGLKFGARHAHARLLGQLLADQLKVQAEMPDCLLPVPLHKARYRDRGFNQASEIARRVAAETGVPLDLTCCLRQRDTPHQTGLTAKQRRRNVKNAFEIVKPISARHVAVVDDVMTTGSTANELAALLKSHGVEQVDVWVCARA